MFQLKKIVDETIEWVQKDGPRADVEELDERLASFQAAVSPLTSQVYAGGQEEHHSKKGRSHEDL